MSAGDGLQQGATGSIVVLNVLSTVFPTTEQRSYDSGSGMTGNKKNIDICITYIIYTYSIYF